MCLVLHDLLDILGTPVMKPLTLGATFAPGEIEVFHDNDVDLEFVRNSCDEVGRLDGNPDTVNRQFYEYKQKCCTRIAK